MRSSLQVRELGVTAPTRLVMLPGAYQQPSDFIAAGFVTAVQSRNLPLDLEIIELRLDELAEPQTVQRLHDEIVVPARAAGCRDLWLAGISLGGLVAISYADRFPDELDGVCLLAPYLGTRLVSGEIERAGGVAAWEPGELADDQDERRLWRWIKNRRADSKPVHLGYGREDRFAASHRLMAQTLPAAAVDVVPGGHDWRAWRQLWENFLDRHQPPAPH